MSAEKWEEICPKCGCGDVNPPDEGSWADCNDCGFVQYEWTLAIQAEVRREQAQCKAILGYVPTLREAVEKGLVKP